ncbi:hypothetical protein [Actinophytocola glycyrrhizae]|uniref:DUF3558 domain-containing protein n=1 Tax=Actinophytocola glycyrrhizae TaxID=2044873 RepID=A0ABV9SAT0_9PSEU
MSRKRFTALIATACIASGCSATHRDPTTTPPSARLGTVEPAYPVGTELLPGTTVIDAIPVADLSTTGHVDFDPDDPCAGVPADVVTPAGVEATPVLDSAIGCVWEGPGIALGISADHRSMAKQVEEHRAMSAGGAVDRLAHLVWLRIDDHYAIERVLEFDRTSSCFLTLDVSSSFVLTVSMYFIDPVTSEPADSDVETAVRERCPTARAVADELLDHLDHVGWWEPGRTPTG